MKSCAKKHSSPIKHNHCPIKKRHVVKGLSLVEILISFGIFSAGIAGLLLASQGMFEGLRVSMARDVESAYANAILSEINPYDPSIETTYDITTKTVKTMPHGEKFFYTRSINSDTATPDVKNINLYLFRSTTATVPYRQFRREVALPFVGYNLGNTSTYFKDSMGRVWQPLANGFYASSTAGSIQNGHRLDQSTYPVTHSTNNGCGFTGERSLFNSTQEAEDLYYRFYVTLGRHYIVRIGTTESNLAFASSGRVFQLYINDESIESFNVVQETGGTCKPMVKSYVVSPVDVGSGLGAIDVRLQDEDDNYAQLAFISIERTEL
jgi:hypothetical protein